MSNSRKLINVLKQDSNKKVSLACRGVIVFMFASILFNGFGLYDKNPVMYKIVAAGMIVMALPTLLYDIIEVKAHWIRYAVLTLISFTTLTLYAYLSYNIILILLLPVLLSCLYCKQKITIFTVLINIPLICLSHIASFYLNTSKEEHFQNLYSVFYNAVFPRLLQFILLSLICINLAKKTQDVIHALIKRNDDLYKDQENLILSLAQMIENQSLETGQHVRRVSEYTKVLCRSLGMNNDDVWKVGLAAMMHDVGKLLIPLPILEKPNNLTEQEFEIMKNHIHYGKKLMEDSPGEIMQISAIIAYEHHERYDGKGYIGLKGSQIDIRARCVTIADVFDALVSHRSYKESWSLERAKQELIDQKGKMFDPDLINLFIKNFDEVTDIYNSYPDNLV